jgi:hypothetical protein
MDDLSRSLYGRSKLAAAMVDISGLPVKDAAEALSVLNKLPAWG